jgi:protein TonB
LLHWSPAETIQDPSAVTVVFSAPAEPAPPLSDPPSEPAPPPALDVPVLAEVPRLAPLPAVRAPSALPRAALPRQRPRERSSPATMQPAGQDAPAVTAPAPAVLSKPSAGAVAAFDALLRQAVQAAVRYPAAAQMMGLTGRARVAFDYKDGAVGTVRLEQSAGSPLLDGAALVAVRGAHYPAPPQALAGQTLSRRLWVELEPGGG